MVPGDVFYFSSNSFILCVNQRKEKVPVLVPKMPRLNPNANVFHSVTPQAMSPGYVSPPVTSWTEPGTSATSDNSPSGGNHIDINGSGLSSGTLQMASVFPPNADSVICPDFGVMSGQLDSSQTLLASGTDVRSSIDEAGPLEDYLEPEQLRMMLKRQLEYYFSRENLAIDAYLISQMDADQFVPIATVANFNQVKNLTRNIDLIVEVLRESANVQVDVPGEKVRPLYKRCIVILREIPESTPIEEVEKLFASESCPTFVSCQFAHNNSWYVTFDNEEDAQRAYRYLREEVISFHGKPIMARIKAKPLLRCSYVAKDVNADCPSSLFPQQKYTYTSPVPNIQYIPPQNLPYFTPHSGMSPMWPTSLIYYDPGMAFAVNGYVPTAAFTPPPPLSACEDLQNPRNRCRFSNRPGALDRADAGENEFRHSWPPQGARDPDDGHYESRRAPRYGGNGPHRIVGQSGPRPEFLRVGGKPQSPRTEANCRSAPTRNPPRISESDGFLATYPGCRSDDVVQEVGVGSSAVSAGSLALPPRTSGSYRSRRKNHHGLTDFTKNSGAGKNVVQTDADGEAFELEESYFPPLPATEKLSAVINEKIENRISDSSQGVVQVVVNATQEGSDQSGFRNEQLKVLSSASAENSHSAAINISFSDADVCPMSAAIFASCDKEPKSLTTSANEVFSVMTPQNLPKRYENCVNCIENCAASEVAGLATTATIFIPDSTSVYSLCPISNMHLSEDDDWKSSLKPSYAQMALRGKERQGKAPKPTDGKPAPTAVASFASVSVATSETRDTAGLGGKENRRERAVAENGCYLLKGHEQRKLTAVPAWN